MRNNYLSDQALVWFEDGGWWFKTFGERFGPYPDCSEARYQLLVIKGLSRQLRTAVRYKYSEK